MQMKNKNDGGAKDTLESLSINREEVTQTMVKKQEKSIEQSQANSEMNVEEKKPVAAAPKTQKVSYFFANY